MVELLDVTFWIGDGELVAFHSFLLDRSLNTQYEMKALFHKRLPHKVKALSRWKSIDIQRINHDEPDYRRISGYLAKQTSLELIALDPFNSEPDGISTAHRRQRGWAA